MPCRQRVDHGPLAIAAVIASCGGSEGGNDTAPDSSTATADSTPGAATDDEATTGGATDDAATDDDATSNDASGGGSATNCDAIFLMAEMEEFFDEPVALSEETDDSLGRLLCTWESIEDPDDLAFKAMTVQVFSGSPIDASSFIDPSIFESVITVEGVGDLAYSSDLLEADIYFLDGPIGGALSYSEVDMGNPNAPKLRDRDAVEQLFRTFHERVT